MKKILFIIIFASFTLFEVFAQQIPSKPEPRRFVNDFANILIANDINWLEDSLLRFERRTTIQIVVVTINSFDGTTAADYAQQLGEKWGVGQSKTNNGVVILIKPKSYEEKGEAFIATGYGLEGALPDVTCNKIVNDIMIPNFRNNNYSQGIINGAISVMAYTDKEYAASAEDVMNSLSSNEEEPSLLDYIITIIIIILFIVFKSPLSYVSGGSRSGWQSFSSGSGSFGGGSFGGGHFGGGGGGGSW